MRVPDQESVRVDRESESHNHAKREVFEGRGLSNECLNCHALTIKETHKSSKNAGFDGSEK